MWGGRFWGLLACPQAPATWVHSSPAPGARWVRHSRGLLLPAARLLLLLLPAAWLLLLLLQVSQAPAAVPEAPAHWLVPEGRPIEESAQWAPAVCQLCASSTLWASLRGFRRTAAQQLLGSALHSGFCFRWEIAGKFRWGISQHLVQGREVPLHWACALPAWAWQARPLPRAWQARRGSGSECGG